MILPAFKGTKTDTLKAIILTACLDSLFLLLTINI
jgi:hypothetical protein